MSDRPVEDNEIPAEIDFSKGVRGPHHIPASAKVFLPVSIEGSVWEYFSGREILTDVLKREIEINEALK